LFRRSPLGVSLASVHHILSIRDRTTLRFKAGGNIYNLSTHPILNSMASGKAQLTTRKRRRASKQKTKVPTPHSVCRATVPSDFSQKHGLEVLRKKSHAQSGEAHASKAFHGFKRAVRIVKRQPVVSAQLRGAILVIGQRIRSGQRSSSKRTICHTSL
jgi:hypothetical protein